VFTLGIPVTSIYKIDSEEIMDILLKVALTPYSFLSVAFAWNGNHFGIPRVNTDYKSKRKGEII
jgi:hypothetical protein